MKNYATATEYNCGIDLHARQMYVCVMDRQGKVLLHTNIEGNDFDSCLSGYNSNNINWLGESPI
jgi:hypothetical protein